MRPTPVTLPHPDLAVNFAGKQWVFVPIHRPTWGREFDRGAGDGLFPGLARDRSKCRRPERSRLEGRDKLGAIASALHPLGGELVEIFLPIGRAIAAER